MNAISGGSSSVSHACQRSSSAGTHVDSHSAHRGINADALGTQQPSPVVMVALMMISRTVPVYGPAALEYNAAPTVA